MREAFMGVPAKGQRIELPGISILHFRNGQCFERWACSDTLVLLTDWSICRWCIAIVTPFPARRFAQNQELSLHGSIRLRLP
jgi:hypothetical protein